MSLRESIPEGAAGHLGDHQTIHDLLNNDLLAYVNHAATSTTARPEVDGTAVTVVLWDGSVEPNNAVEGDYWWDTDRGKLYRKDSGGDFVTNAGRYEVITYTADNTFVPGNYPWAYRAKITCVGGGGSGAQADATGSGGSGGSGGGGGATAIAYVLLDDMGASESVTVGAGATANNSDGGTSSFGSFASAGGGQGGQTRAPSSTPFGEPGGGGGTATAGDLQIGGNPGGPVWLNGQLGFSGNGGGSTHGGGGRGQATSSGGQNIPGGDGSAYGGGGGGGINTSGVAVVADGGDGTDGIVIVELFG